MNKRIKKCQLSSLNSCVHLMSHKRLGPSPLKFLSLCFNQPILQMKGVEGNKKKPFIFRSDKELN